MKAFEKRLCIRECHVNVGELLERSASFALLYDQGGLEKIFHFPELSRFCPHLTCTFYLCAGHLKDEIGGPLEFRTIVHNVLLAITPQMIADALGMETQVVGLPYTQGHTLTNLSWRKVVDGVCLPHTVSAGNSIFSKELRPEYHFLNFIVCYNILLTMQMKVVRWEQLLYMYLVGHPMEARGLNLNIPYLVWSRMTKDMKNPHPSERLPFPLIIMRILHAHKIDTRSTNYQHSLRTINESTVIKSLPRQVEDPPPAPRAPRAPHAPPAPSPLPAPPAPTASGGSRLPIDISEDDASVTSIYREQ